MGHATPEKIGCAVYVVDKCLHCLLAETNDLRFLSTDVDSRVNLVNGVVNNVNFGARDLNWFGTAGRLFVSFLSWLR